jgi:hypothetical protein
MMFNSNDALGKGMRLLLIVLIGLNFACSRNGKDKGIDVVLDRYRQLGHRMDEASKSIARTISAPREPIPMEQLTESKSIAPVAAEAANQAISFRLDGVVLNESVPLVMTSHGVVGLGGEVDGFKVVDIQEDAVTFSDQQGHLTKILLYKDGSTP